MPVKELVAALEPTPRRTIREVADGLLYRDFITVGLLAEAAELAGRHTDRPTVPDNWIYIQEPDVKSAACRSSTTGARTWSPTRTVWLGLEYFCNEGDELWRCRTRSSSPSRTEELAKIGIIDNERRARRHGRPGARRPIRPTSAPTTAFRRGPRVRRSLRNLFLVGRNGMHRYNNQDHSMLTAMTAVDNIVDGETDKANIWDVNTESDYHEEK